MGRKRKNTTVRIVSIDELCGENEFPLATTNKNQKYASCSYDSPRLEDLHVSMYFSNGKKTQLEDVFYNPKPLGLKLTITSSFMKSIEDKVNEEKTNIEEAEKFPIHCLKIGSFKVWSIHEGDLAAKCCYGCGKLSWEILENSMWKKIEMQWNNISALRAYIKENVLEIQLKTPPAFSQLVTPPMPSMHAHWISSKDFTGGQASNIQRGHYLQFPPGVLEKYLEKLMQFPHRFESLSYTDSQSHQRQTDKIISQNLHGSKTTSACEQQPMVSTQVQQFGNAVPWSPNGINDSCSSTVNTQRLQEPWNHQGLDDCYEVLAMESAYHEHLHEAGPDYEEFNDFLKILLSDCDPPTLSNIYSSGFMSGRCSWSEQ